MDEGRLHKKILVLEDSKAQAERLVTILLAQGYSVVAVRDGVNGLKALDKSVPDLIISDVWMPEMNGFEFCRKVKQERGFSDIPLILLTTLSRPKDIIEGLNAGADYYLTKPYDEDLLTRMVASVAAAGNGRARRTETFEVRAGGRAETIKADPRQVANFLFSTYENLLSYNSELTRARRELKSANDYLEQRVREKTMSLEEEVAERKRSHEAVERALNGTVTALSRAVDMRDPYTAGHQARVSELAVRIGSEMGLSGDRLQGIRVAGLLHDIGKIIVPAEILTKPSRLNDYEFLFIKAHSQAGYDILKEIEFPWPVATAVLQHHERMNGSGYPLGLTRDEIITEARILAIADVVESMSSHRPYRPALGIDAAMREIADNVNSLYDPHAADALIRALPGSGIA